MLTLRDLHFDPASLGPMILTEIVPVYEYVEHDRTDKILGYRYIVALPETLYKRLAIKIDPPQRMEMPEAPVEVEFQNLEMSVYEIRGKVNISARATGVRAVTHKP